MCALIEIVDNLPIDNLLINFDHECTERLEKFVCNDNVKAKGQYSVIVKQNVIQIIYLLYCNKIFIKDCKL